jgi:hypothetical protein
VRFCVTQRGRVTKPLENARFATAAARQSTAVMPLRSTSRSRFYSPMWSTRWDIASVAGVERLREIMAALVDRAALVVQRSEGTVGEFTGDGIMAVLGGRP